MSADDLPRIKVISLHSGGVTLFGSSDPGFAAAFPHLPAKDWDPLLPYTVVIGNQSSKDIAAYSIVWRCTGWDKVIRTGVRSVFDFLGDAGFPHAGPRATQIVSLAGSVEIGGKPGDKYARAHVGHLPELFENRSSIEIMIDAVLFVDDSTLEEDTQGWFPRWRAHRDATAEICSRTAQTPDGEVASLLQPFANRAIAMAEAKPSELGRNAALLNVMADHAGSYEECRTLASGSLASSILNDLATQGFSALERIRSIARRRRLSVPLDDSSSEQ